MGKEVVVTHPEAKVEGVKFWHPELSNIVKCVIGRGTVVHSNVWIGDGGWIGERCKIEAFVFIPPGVTIEDDVFVGPGVIFTNDPHFGWLEGKEGPTSTLVESNARIGAGAKIRAGVHIEGWSTIGMGSVVLQDVPFAETWVGNPARKLYGQQCGHP